MTEKKKIAKTIVLKNTLNCNLRCKYCYEFDRKEHETLNTNIMSANDTIDIIKRFANLFPESNILWMLHGGEPLLANIETFKYIANTIRQLNTETGVNFQIAVQTNGTLINDEWIEFFEKNIDLFSERVISVSIDGPNYINDVARINKHEGRITEKVLSNINKLKKSKMDISTISVIGSHNVQAPKEMYNFIKDLNPDFAKFIPCYNFNSEGTPERLGITPLQYAQFMCNVFDCWIHDLPTLPKNKWNVIDPIATIVASISNSFISWCEYRKEKCNNFMTIFPNGELWLCDTFDQNIHKDFSFLGNIYSMGDDTLSNIIINDSNNCCKFDEFEKNMLIKCSQCDINKYCHGGCLPQRHSLLKTSEKLFDEYCAAKHILINHIQKAVSYALFES